MELRPPLRDRAVVGAALGLLRRVATQFASGPLPEWEEFARSATLRVHPAKSLIEMGDADVAFVVRGLVKLVEEETGRVAEFFATGTAIAPNTRPSWAPRSAPPMTLGRWIGERWSLRPMSVIALERTSLLHIDYRVVETLAARHTEWGQVHAAFLWTYIDGLYLSGERALEKDVAERYRQLMRRRGLRGRATQRDIASYLNVTESALSRIVRRSRPDSPRGT
ncbi:hypothetical protein GCM10009775_11860 [Microbacterium aoyamense]|uniref:Crp/Fnr family transcriptional regulator n=1 Tax=Microbacterium aoyamense TaxID=344166 RepID=A0ABN2PH69_9MICO|nr:hypothetical protein [Microbacterium aoyamense]